jgi:hypothetical protein
VIENRHAAQCGVAGLFGAIHHADDPRREDVFLTAGVGMFDLTTVALGTVESCNREPRFVREAVRIDCDGCTLDDVGLARTTDRTATDARTERRARDRLFD